MVNVIVDSGCDVNKEMVENEFCRMECVPLNLHFEDRVYVDDDSLDIDEFIAHMDNSPTSVKSASPSPGLFIEKFKKEGSVFVVTLTSKLSGTYQNAMLAQKMYLEEYGKKFIHVFDSFSASIAEGLIAMKISEFAKKGFSNLEIVDNVNHFIKNMRTYILLDKFDNLVKTGRISPAIAKIASLLNIKPICTAKNGEIQMLDKVRGYNKAVSRLIEYIRENTPNLESAVVGISHVKCYEKAVALKNEILKVLKVKNVLIVEAKGIVTTYANRGGLVVSV